MIAPLISFKMGILCVGPAEAKLVSAPLQLDARRLLLLAVNDNPFVEVRKTCLS